MPCQAYGTDNTSDRRFCAGCGVPLAVTCTGCGFQNQPDARFSLNFGDWESVERYAVALEDYTRPEPLPWCDFFIARGRALMAFGRVRRNGEVLAELGRLRGHAEGAGIRTAIPGLDDALRTADGPPAVARP